MQRVIKTHPDAQYPIYLAFLFMYQFYRHVLKESTQDLTPIKDFLQFTHTHLLQEKGVLGLHLQEKVHAFYRKMGRKVDMSMVCSPGVTLLELYYDVKLAQGVEKARESVRRLNELQKCLA